MWVLWNRCEMKYVLLEMDRILRPTGYVIMRESPHFVNSVSNLDKGMRWSCQKRDTKDARNEKEKLLICQKKNGGLQKLLLNDNL